MRIVIEIEHENDAFQLADGSGIDFINIGGAIERVGSIISQRVVEGSLRDPNGNFAIQFWVTTPDDNGQQENQEND